MPVGVFVSGWGAIACGATAAAGAADTRGVIPHGASTGWPPTACRHASISRSSACVSRRAVAREAGPSAFSRACSRRRSASRASARWRNAARSVGFSSDGLTTSPGSPVHQSTRPSAPTSGVASIDACCVLRDRETSPAKVACKAAGDACPAGDGRAGSLTLNAMVLIRFPVLLVGETRKARRPWFWLLDPVCLAGA